MSDLSVEVKAKEIHEKATSYYNVSQEYGYKFLMEVKKIRDERLFEHLGFSTFVSYCLSSWGYEHDYMNERIRMADEFKEEYDGYSRSLGHKKTLLLARMPEPQREQALENGVPTEQGYKSYDEATQKEIADYKRNAEEMERKAKEYEKQLKQRDELIASREEENEILQSKLEDAENKEPEVIERYSEPDDYEDLKYLVKRQEEILSGREEHVSKLEKEIADMRAKRSDMDRKSKEYDQLNQAINEMNGRLDKGQKRIAAQKEVYDLVRNANRLIEEIAPLSYLVNTEEILDNEYAVKPIKKLIKNLNDITKRLNESINQTEILEVN